MKERKKITKLRISNPSSYSLTSSSLRYAMIKKTKQFSATSSLLKERAKSYTAISR